MNREAVALGVPVYTVFAGRLGAVDERLLRGGAPATARLCRTSLGAAQARGRRRSACRRDPALLLDLMLSALRLEACETGAAPSSSLSGTGRPERRCHTARSSPVRRRRSPPARRSRSGQPARSRRASDRGRPRTPGHRLPAPARAATHGEPAPTADSSDGSGRLSLASAAGGDPELGQKTARLPAPRDRRGGAWRASGRHRGGGAPRRRRPGGSAARPRRAWAGRPRPTPALSSGAASSRWTPVATLAPNRRSSSGASFETSSSRDAIATIRPRSLWRVCSRSPRSSAGDGCQPSESAASRTTSPAGPRARRRRLEQRPRPFAIEERGSLERDVGGMQELLQIRRARVRADEHGLLLVRHARRVEGADPLHEVSSLLGPGGKARELGLRAGRDRRLEGLRSSAETRHEPVREREHLRRSSGSCARDGTPGRSGRRRAGAPAPHP